MKSMKVKRLLFFWAAVTIFSLYFSIPVSANIETIIPPEYNFTLINEQDEVIRYTIDLAGYRFQGQGVYHKHNSIYLEKIWINTPERFWYGQDGQLLEENKEFVFCDVKLLAEQGVVGTYIDRIESGIDHSGWPLTIKEITLNRKGLGCRGLIYLPMKSEKMPVWFSMDLDLSFEPGIAYMYNYDYNFIRKEGPLYIIRSKLEDGRIVVEEAVVSYRTTDDQQKDLSIYNFVIDKNGLLSIDSSYRGERYQIQVGNIELEIPGIIPTLEGDGLQYSLDFKPAVSINYKNNINIGNKVRVLNTEQEILLDHPYLDQLYLTGTLNNINFQSSKGVMKNGDIDFDIMSFVFSVTENSSESSVISLSNVTLGKNGFILDKTEIIEPFFIVKTLGRIRVTDINIDTKNGITMEGTITLEGEVANILTDVVEDNIIVEPFLLTEEGIDGLTMKITEGSLEYYKGLITFDQIEWKPNAGYD
ncbi:MAG: hypothetical protein ACLFUI_09440, partial [Halanaerobiales bacterium]